MVNKRQIKTKMPKRIFSMQQLHYKGEMCKFYYGFQMHKLSTVGISCSISFVSEFLMTLLAKLRCYNC